jgi:osmoprotectant transport system permease protein
VDSSIKEAAAGMGMTDWQRLIQVELPIAFPVIMAGIRTALVMTIGVATLAGLIGGGGLGDLIVRGLSIVNDALIVVGTVPAALMALIADFLMGRLERWLTPRGLRV